jgi:S-DNA-T family DNA segregation ATPase FtsK/SpoIIIE
MAFPLFAPRRALGVSHDGVHASSPNPANTRMASVLGAGAGRYTRGREVAALLLWTVAVFLVLALASYAGDPAVALLADASVPPIPGDTLPAVIAIRGENWVGPVGESCARALVSLIGVIAWSIPLEFALLGVPFVRGRKSLITPARLAGDFLIVVLAAALVQVGGPGKLAFGHHAASGAVGELFGELARSLFSTVGSFLVGFACLGLILIARATFSFIALMHAIAGGFVRAWLWTTGGVRSVAVAWNKARQIEREKATALRRAQQPHIEETRHDEAVLARLPDEIELGLACGIGDAPTATPPPVVPAPKKRAPRRKKDPLAASSLEGAGAPTSDAKGAVKPAADEAYEVVFEKVEREDDSPLPANDQAPMPVPLLKKGARPPAASVAQAVPIAPMASMAPMAPVVAVTAPDETPVVPVAAPLLESARASSSKKVPLEPIIIDTSAALVKEEPVKVAPRPQKDRMVPAIGAGFRLPPIDFLIPAKVDPTLAIDKEALFRNAELLVKTLSDYGVSGKVEDILPGPTVTTFEVSPAAGTKVSKVAALADDLALALAKKVRIVAPIPGKNRIGFELPNEKRVPVNLRDLVEDRRFQTFDVPLPVVMGRDITGNPVYADLASMPHVIVAGATGAGKSVGLNVMLTSLLYRRTPEELRLLMIDPKVVELAPFDRIPHMLLPVVTDMKQASNALKWAVDEMERRYQLFADAGTRNIGTYNGWVERVIKGEVRNPAPKVVISKDHNGFPDAIRPADGEEGEAPLPEKLPQIVIVVDEFADLMMQQGKEVESAVARLAQKARAAGMHVILATQRPSVDVITGMIKANFPTRIAFRVAQKVDSRTILDEQGAEHLLGRGDMLIKLNGTNETKRVQCPMVSEEEVQAVTDFLRLQGEPVYDENILKPRDDDGEPVEEDAEQDAMYDEAVRLVAETRRCSTSWLQRKLMLGYNRAARIVEMMERRGLVGAANGAKDREVLISAL